MLQQTFIHVPGIGLVRERRLWEAGIRTWNDYLAAYNAEDVRHLKPLMEFVYQTCYSDLQLAM